MDNGQLTMAGFKNNLSYMSSLIFIYYNLYSQLSSLNSPFSTLHSQLSIAFI